MDAGPVQFSDPCAAADTARCWLQKKRKGEKKKKSYARQFFSFLSFLVLSRLRAAAAGRAPPVRPVQLAERELRPSQLPRRKHGGQHVQVIVLVMRAGASLDTLNVCSFFFFFFFFLFVCKNLGLFLKENKIKKPPPRTVIAQSVALPVVVDNVEQRAPPLLVHRAVDPIALERCHFFFSDV
jgi:hypothetical protein